MDTQPKKEKPQSSRKRVQMTENSNSAVFYGNFKNPNINEDEFVSQWESPTTSRRLYLSEGYSKEIQKMGDNLLEGVNIDSKKSFRDNAKSSKNLTLRDNSRLEIGESQIIKRRSILPCDVERLSLGYDKTPSINVSERSNYLFSESLIRDIAEREDGSIRYDNKTKSYPPFKSPPGITEESSIENCKTFKKKFMKFNRKQSCDEEWKKKKKEMKALKKLEKEQKVWILKYLDFPLDYEEDMDLKRRLQDCYYHILQLILITAIAMSMMTSEMFFFKDKMVNLFFDEITLSSSNSSNETNNSSELHQRKTLRDSTNINDFWAFAETSLLNLLYSDFLNPYIDPVTHTAEDDITEMYENQILGVARIRQVRVYNNSCEIHPDMKRFFKNCYAHYSVITESTETIRYDMEGRDTATAWKYTEAKKLETSFYWGEISNYGGGGYYLDLAKNKEKSENMLQELRKNDWVSKATRAVFIDFTIYNANVNLFCLCKIVVEFLPMGGILPTPDFNTLKLIRYLTIFDFFIMGCEFLYLILIVYQTLREIMKIHREKSLYFFSLWNYIQILILTLSYIFIALDIARYIYVQRLISKLEARYYQYTEFNFVKDLQINFNNITALLLFFTWVKVFSFFNFTRSMVRFQRTLARSLINMMMFFPMFITMLSAFSILAYLLFGHQDKQYKSLWDSFLTLLQAFLGEFNYTSILETNRVLGPIFYITFVFFVFFVLVNVFIAIINDAYASVMSLVLPDSSDVFNYIRRGFVNAFTCCRPRLKIKKVNFSMKKKFLFHEIQQALKRAGFKDKEINIFFHKYNINFMNFLSEETRYKIMKDLKFKEFEITETSEQFQINILKAQFDDLKEKIDCLDMKLQPIIDKVDIVLHRL